MYIATIDTGTTNTKVKIWKDNEVVSRSFVEAGVRDTAITGSREKLKQGVKRAVEIALERAGIKEQDVSLFLASGMITSNVGLFEVPHVWAPAGIEELAAGMLRADIKEVVDKPIWFVPGIKNNVKNISLENCEAMDIMRGEESETMGMLECLKVKGPAVVILPGSHSKFISINEKNQVIGCVTTLAGELISVITNNTILANALNNSFVEEVKEEFLVKGADYAKKVGLNRVCFTVRILDQFTKYSYDEKANFLMGAVFGTDLSALKNSTALNINPESPVIIGGSRIMKRAFEILIKNDDYFKAQVQVVDDESMKDMAGRGAIAVARIRGLF